MNDVMAHNTLNMYRYTSKRNKNAHFNRLNLLKQISQRLKMLK